MTSLDEGDDHFSTSYSAPNGKAHTASILKVEKNTACKNALACCGLHLSFLCIWAFTVYQGEDPISPFFSLSPNALLSPYIPPPTPPAQYNWEYTPLAHTPLHLHKELISPLVCLPWFTSPFSLARESAGLSASYYRHYDLQSAQMPYPSFK